MVTKIFKTLIALMFIPTLCFAAPLTMYVTVAGAGNNSGDTWSNAMSLADWETDAGTACSSEAGDHYYVMQGEYTLNEAWDCPNDGTPAAPISMTGVKTGTTAEPPTIADWAYTTARPLVTSGENSFNFDNGWSFRNMRHETTNISGWGCDNNCYGFNLKSTNSDGLRCAFTWDGVAESNMINCEANGGDTSGCGFLLGTTSLINSYAHDTADCIRVIQAGTPIIGNIIETCTVKGIETASTREGLLIVGNTFYNNAINIELDGAGNITVVDNIFDTSTTGITYATTVNSIYIDYNLYSNISGNDVEHDEQSVPTGANAVIEDITLTDPTANPPDMTLPAGTGAEDAGIQPDSAIIAGDYKRNIGLDQDDNATGGGTTAYGYMN